MLRLIPALACPVLACLIALSPAAQASGPGETVDPVAEGAVDVTGGLPYAVFEEAIEHADLAGCPKGYDLEKVFCRIALAQGRAHVFVFNVEGEQMLVAVKSYGLDDGFLPF